MTTPEPAELKPCPDAVDALNTAFRAIVKDAMDLENYLLHKTPMSVDEQIERTSKMLAKHLLKDGLTITRHPAMSDAELEREADSIAFNLRSAPEKANAIIKLVKKYRGIE